VRSGRYSQTLPLGHHVRRTTLPPRAVDAVFEQSGVIQTSSLGDMFDVAAILAYQPLPRGDRVAVLGTSAALEILAADAVESVGMSVAYGQPSLAQSAEAPQIRDALRGATEDIGTDSVVFVHIPSVGADQADVHAAIMEVSTGSTKPVIAVMPAADGTGLIPAGMGLLTVAGPDGRPEHGSVPTFSNVEDAVRALALVRGYARWRDAERVEIPAFPDIDPERARALVDGWLTEAEQDDTTALPGPDEDPDTPEPTSAGLDLSADQVAELLGCYGIRVWPARHVRSEDQAVAAADELGYPVVLKTTAPWLAHRVDLGSVRMNLESERAVRGAYLSMLAQLDAMAGQRLVVQGMAPPGVSTVVGAVDDPLFGPVVRFGLGGVASDLLGDHAYRIPPVSMAESRRLVAAPKAAPLLRGYRGADPVDVESLCTIIARLGLLVDEIPSLAALELNPIIVSGWGSAVLGATGRIRRNWDRLDVGVRRLLDG
jgi:acyl-CoA synthetase (NDP forming)